jgi:CubicO group peptidase (beta-lactamase class C family)
MKKQVLILTQILTLIFGLLFNLTIAQQEDYTQLATEFDKLLAEKFNTNEPGAAILVAWNGEIIYKKAFGMANLEYDIPMQVDNVFRIGSITKQFTAVSILQLMEQGKLNLQDDITRFIPDYPTSGYKITIEHLLAHTSGIQSYTSMEDYMQRITLDMKPAEMIEYFKNQPMKFAPGTEWEYSNSNYFLLGYIIEKISGKTYAEYIEENFFKPLGMINSLYGSDTKIIKKRANGYAIGENGFENAKPLSMTQPYAAGSIQSTVEDLFKWHQAIHSYKLIKKESLDKAFTKYKLADGEETDYGYGWGLGFVQGSPTIDHGGGINGFGTMAIYLPEEDVFTAVFSNCECSTPKEIAIKLAALTIGKPINAQTEIKVDEKILETYTGEYEITPEFTFSVTKEEDRLFLQATGQEKFEIFAETENKFFLKINDAQLEFIKDDSGNVTKAILNQSGRQTDAKKIK